MLAQLYEPGRQLWRVELRHFTPWDCNWPPGPLPEIPPVRPPEVPVEPEESKCKRQGWSIVSCQGQALGEHLPITGTPFALSYTSLRAPGRTDHSREIDIQATPAVIPPSLHDMRAFVHVAGRTTILDGPLTPNRRHTYAWNGLDAYGRAVHGGAEAWVALRYTATRSYGVPVPAGGSSWAAFPAPGSSAGAQREAVDGAQYHPPVTIGTLTSARPDIEGGEGLGGWTLDVHHAYDPLARVLHLGSGELRKAEAGANVIGTFAGRSQSSCSPGFGGDGGQAKDAYVMVTSGMDMAPDGSLYFADSYSHRVRRISPDGIVRTIAGSGPFNKPVCGSGGSYVFGGYSGDGGPATSATMDSPHDVTIGPDGLPYIADSSNSRVRRINADGTITTVAGGGSGGDGGPATEASLLTVRGVAFGPDGSMYFTEEAGGSCSCGRVRKVATDGTISTIAHSGQGLRWPWGIDTTPAGDVLFTDIRANKVFRVDPAGRLTTFAGNCGSGPFPGDGEKATDVVLSGPRDASVARDGSVYIGEQGHRVRKVTTDGIIRTIAGTGRFSGPLGDEGLATQATINDAFGVEATPDGRVLGSDQGNYRIREIRPPMPGYAEGDVLLPSENGQEAYKFDRTGRHLETRDAFTRAQLWKFDYDGAGRLTTVTDVDGDLTQIERDASGTATAIVAPGGQRTELRMGAGGWLAGVSNPADEVTELEYGTGGLLTKLTDAEEHEREFTYDAKGLLVRDEGPDGSSLELTRTRFDDGGSRVVSEDALGHETAYETRPLAAGGTSTTVTGPSGAQTVTQTGPRGVTMTTYPDGTEVETTAAPDPRWAVLVGFAGRQVFRRPGKPDVTVSTQRRHDLANPADLLDLSYWGEGTNIGGRDRSQVYDGEQRTLTETTPEGRTTITKFDAKGRVVEVARRDADGDGPDPQTYAWDAHGRLERTERGGRVVTYSYDAADRVATRGDGTGRTLGYAWDDADRLIRVDRPGGSSTHYAHDRNGNRTKVAMPGGDEHVLGYTSVDRLRSYDPPGQAAGIVRDWDTARRLDKTTLPSAREIDWRYDAAGGGPRGRCISDGETAISYPGTSVRADTLSRDPAGAAPAQTIGLAYAGDLLTGTTFGGPAAGAYEYAHDALGALTGMTLTSGPDNHETALTRDLDGELTGIGAVHRHTRRAGGRRRHAQRRRAGARIRL